MDSSEYFLGASLFVLLGSLFVAVIWIILWTVIFKKAGHTASLLLGILMAIPLANIFMFLVFALGQWPIERELWELKSRFKS